MDNKKSKDTALRLLKAISIEEVDHAIKLCPEFTDDKNWQPYGGHRKNWDRIGAQTSEPVGAFAELIINSIDAILMKKYYENRNSMGENIDMPQSMPEAVKKFFPHVVEGKIALLSSAERTILAEQSILVGVKRDKDPKYKKYPTYTIADFGEGQNAKDFPKTLLSLGQDNKEGIPFVQGRFNMGSTGSIGFCTKAEIKRGLYKFIMSKRNLADSDENWGWTLIRTQGVKRGEKSPVVEYFYPGEIPSFNASEIRAFGRNDIGKLSAGTIVKLYNYDIGPDARNVDFGLYFALTTSLLECALPIRIYDFDATPTSKGELRKEGIADRTFSGMKIAFDSGEVNDITNNNIDLPTYQVIQSEENISLGRIKVLATGIKKLPRYLEKYPYRFFYTVNGQTQAKGRASFLRKAKLSELRNHLIVQVDCNAMDATARSSIFKSDRERMNNNELSREFESLIVNALSEDGKLQDYARQIRARRVTDTIQNNELGRKLWKTMLNDNPELADLFAVGEDVVGKKGSKGTVVEYKGKFFPTFLKLKKPKDGVLHLPINTYRHIECETDVNDDYLSRLKDNGDFFFNRGNFNFRHSMKLRGGKLTITVRVPEVAVVGQSSEVVFGFTDSSRPEPLEIKVKVNFVEAEKPKKPGVKTRKKPSGGGASFPDFQPVYKEKWDEHEFNEESGAECAPNGEGVIIYVNMDNKYLHSILNRTLDNSERELINHMFKLGVGILTFSIYKKFDDELKSEWEEHIKHASSAISAHVVTLMQKLGGQK